MTSSARPSSYPYVPDAWLVAHSRLEATDALGWQLAHHRLPIELLLASASDVEERRHDRCTPDVSTIATNFYLLRAHPPCPAPEIAQTALVP